MDETVNYIQGDEMSTERLTIDLANNTANRPGMAGGTLKVVKINQDRTHAVIRVPGGTHFTGLYRGTTYHKQRTIVYDITELKSAWRVVHIKSEHGIEAKSAERLEGSATVLVEYEGR